MKAENPVTMWVFGLNKCYELTIVPADEQYDSLDERHQ